MLTIEEHSVKVTVNNGIAVTEVTQVFRNTENRQVEALYTFPIPKGATVANFSMWINGKEMIGEVVDFAGSKQRDGVEAMTWLETFLAEYPGAVLFVTHDRVFFQRLATRIMELDRGRLTSWPGDYATFLRRKEEWLANEVVQNKKFDKRLAEEEAWLRQGIKARRTRNEGRVRALLAMRKERAACRTQVGAVRLQIEMTDRSGQLVFEAERLNKSFDTDPVVRDLSVRVMRGDRMGLIGSNGSGKTTLLRLLIGEIDPDAGEVRRGANVQIAYYDQEWLAHQLEGMCADGLQIVITTHSPAFVNMMNIRGLALVRKDGGHSTAVQKTVEELVAHCLALASGAPPARTTPENILPFYTSNATRAILEGLILFGSWERRYRLRSVQVIASRSRQVPPSREVRQPQ